MKNVHPIFQEILSTVMPRQPDIDLCSSCGEHTEFEETDDGYLSECCGSGPYDTDYEVGE